MTHNTPMSLYNRQDKNSPEKLLLERLEIILDKRFEEEYGEEELGYTPDDMANAYYHGAEEVKEYLTDALKIYAYEKGVYCE
jgi:hypothetical protein